MRTQESEEMESKIEIRKLGDPIFTGSGATKPEGAPEVEVAKSSVKKSCINSDTLFNETENEYERETISVFTEKVNRVLGDPPYSTRGARG